MPSPTELRSLPKQDLPALAARIRELLVRQVCATGGHLGPNLGVVELTIALHRVFDSPRDTLVFDIGHQGYVHKLLTGRQKDFDSLRSAGGLSGYLSRRESPHDLVENSHASTALSYADGLARARQLAGSQDTVVVAVIGDGALTGGMAWEALNNIGAAADRPVIVVVNDNGRSYAPTNGALADHLASLRRNDGTSQVSGNLFTILGLEYIGPVDGHDMPALEDALQRARAAARPVVVHAVTVKGRGYAPAEEDTADCFHAVGVLDPATGRPPQDSRSAPDQAPPATAWTEVFGQELLAVARERNDVVAVTASMLRPTGLHTMADVLPARVFDVGIAEPHAVTCAAGMAMAGLHPVVAIYSTFLNRAFDQVLMDVALHSLPVTFVLDRAGVTGPDGASHHGMWDLTLLATVPGLRVAVPRDGATLRELLGEALVHTAGPTALRFPKGTAGPDLAVVKRLGTIDVLHQARTRDVLLVTAGPLAAEGLQAARILAQQGIGVTVVDPRWILPVRRELLDLAHRHDMVVTVEDNTRSGGMGSAIARAIADTGTRIPVRVLGLPSQFIPHDTRTSILTAAGLTSQGIAHSVLRARAGLPASP
ncbi:1-deoxy-D-xylulose-5-phosphate synthase [Streptomyces vinaceus]|uniref:1-deoxy-D-xylulose-5-phosphate synthase n=1 Tax=Streptomyces vinaceus TaxID=1960 RepID=UPI0036A8AF32